MRGVFVHSCCVTQNQSPAYRIAGVHVFRISLGPEKDRAQSTDPDQRDAIDLGAHIVIRNGAVRLRDRGRG